MNIIEMEEKNELLLKNEREKNLTKFQNIIRRKKRIAKNQSLDLIEDS